MENTGHETSIEKSFDVLSSVRLYRYDLQTVGHIKSETRQRVYDEELSYIAEGINRPNYTEFVLNEQNGELVFFHEGQWRPYLSTLYKGMRTAQAEAADDPRKQFEADRRADDLNRGYRLQNLKRGERLAWYYEFPRAETGLYGDEFMIGLGFYPERAMGYLCDAQKTADGRLILRHQSVDNSDRDGFGAAMAAADEGADIHFMTAAYDQALSHKNGGDYFAGRIIAGGEAEENAWTAILKHHDLTEYLMSQVEAIARQNLTDAETEAAKKRLTYGVWAKLKERLDEQSLDMAGIGYGGSGGSISAQVQSAYESASARGDILVGCGGSITAENAILQASPGEVFDSIFGANKKKWFGCYYCGAKQYGDPCASRLYCPSCTAEVKDGKVISTGKSKTIKKGFFDIIFDELQEWNRQYNAAQAEKKVKPATRSKEAPAKILNKSSIF